jgi:SynChlorMet cassette radical SAM/SPASM protein ScmF
MKRKVDSEKQEERKQLPKPECGHYLSSIYFYLTEGCNLRCRHCWIKPPFESEKTPKFPYVDLETFKHITEQALELGLVSVKLTGGEPMIHPAIEKIIEYVHEKDLQLTVETNGTALTPELARLILSSNKDVSLSISLDSHLEEMHEWVRGVKGSFNAALTGVKYMHDAGYRPQIIMSVMRRNVGHIEDLVRLAESIGAGSVKFNPVIPTARGKQLHEIGEALTVRELLELGRFVDDDLQLRSRIPLFYTYTAAFRSVRNIKARPNNSGCNIMATIGVLGTGKYALCGIGESLPEFVFGNARTDSLKEIWNNTPLLNEIRAGLPSRLSGVCSDCVMKEGCLGCCIAKNYSYYKKVFAPDPYCQLAYEAGLFPKSRLRPGSPHDLNYLK